MSQGRAALTCSLLFIFLFFFLDSDPLSTQSRRGEKPPDCTIHCSARGEGTAQRSSAPEFARDNARLRVEVIFFFFLNPSLSCWTVAPFFFLPLLPRCRKCPLIIVWFARDWGTSKIAKSSDSHSLLHKIQNSTLKPSAIQDCTRTLGLALARRKALVPTGQSNDELVHRRTHEPEHVKFSTLFILAPTRLHVLHRPALAQYSKQEWSENVLPCLVASGVRALACRELMQALCTSQGLSSCRTFFFPSKNCEPCWQARVWTCCSG